jgi:aldose sugar dehydrogenase
MGAFPSVWHLLAAAAIFVVPIQFEHGAVWTAPHAPIVFGTGLALTYLACAAALFLMNATYWPLRRERWWLPPGIFAAYFLSLLVTRAFYSRSMLLVGLALSAAGIALPFIIPRAWRRTAAAALGGLVMLAVAAGFIDNASTRGSRVHATRNLVGTSLYNLRETHHQGYFGRRDSTSVDGGGLAVYHDQLLLATGEGLLYLVSIKGAGGGLVVTPLTYRVPMNTAAFVRDAPADVKTRRFRTAGLLVQETGEQVRLVVSHHYWDPERRCFTLRISELDFPGAALVSAAPASWQTLYETSPCLGFDTLDKFTGNQAGGKLQLLDSHRLLVTVGDHGFDGVNAPARLPQDMTAAYGKTVLIDLDTHESLIYSLGHRNPQGLYVAPDGAVWLTEQGPQGGDELNLLSRSANYGWPQVTYGTDYDRMTWPLNGVQGEHVGFTLPVYAWVPSIVVSNLVGVEGGRFTLWRHDLLVSSLVDEALWRLRVREGRVVVAERMPVGERIRDLARLEDGRLVLWTDSRSIVVIEPQLEAAGLE